MLPVCYDPYVGTLGRFTRAEIISMVAAAGYDGLNVPVNDAFLGDAGAVAAALMTGDRGAIPEAVLQDMRDAGLAHLLAISGLHVGLIVGWLFFTLRFLQALVPGLALRAPIKKWAAAAALLPFGAAPVSAGCEGGMTLDIWQPSSEVGALWSHMRGMMCRVAK